MESRASVCEKIENAFKHDESDFPYAEISTLFSSRNGARILATLRSRYPIVSLANSTRIARVSAAFVGSLLKVTFDPLHSFSPFGRNRVP